MRTEAGEEQGRRAGDGGGNLQRKDIQVDAAASLFANGQLRGVQLRLHVANGRAPV